MRLHLLFLAVCLLAACSSTQPSPAPPVPDPCPKATAAIRRNSCVAIQAASGPLAAVFAWADGINTWPKGEGGIAEVSVQFLEGSEWARQMVWKRLNIIDQYAEGLRFRMADHGEVGDVRVSFRCDGHWSYLGRQALRIPEGSSTMNVGLDRRHDDREWDRVVLHEGLHAVGFEHEHQHPQAEIPWDREAVYQFYGQTQGWDRRMVDFQVLNRAAPKQLRTTGFDVDSIMMYPCPEELTLGNFSVGWNTMLTRSDIALLRELYPGPRVEQALSTQPQQASRKPFGF